MKKVMVTGAAGFVGSHLSEALTGRGIEVVGVDAFIPYYPREIKNGNLSGLLKQPLFRFVEADLRTADIRPLMEGCETIFHLAAMPGLMKSWSDFSLYNTCNVDATLRLLEAARDTKPAQFIHISTSSVYGKEATQGEEATLQPFSPYGISKLAAEHLCRAFESNFGLPVTVLRYFSVYGPRQRPDMAYNILIKNLLTGGSFTMFGDGEQTRSNTFVSDCVKATMLAADQREAALGQVFNVGGGEIVSLNAVIRQLEQLTGQTANIEHKPPRPGDQKHTAANIGKIQRLLGYQPTTPYSEGLAAQVAWQKQQLGC